MNNKKETRDLSLPPKRYLAVLQRQRQRIATGVPLDLDDSDYIGDKYTHASWGLCSEDHEAWPDPEDHLWPDQFVIHGRVAPLYRRDGQLCPFDRQDGDEFSKNKAWGCFYRCRLFSPKGKLPTQQEALDFYDDAIRKAQEES